MFCGIPEAYRNDTADSLLRRHEVALNMGLGAANTHCRVMVVPFLVFLKVVRDYLLFFCRVTTLNIFIDEIERCSPFSLPWCTELVSQDEYRGF